MAIMRSKSTNIKNELASIKKALNQISEKEANMEHLVDGKAKAEDAASTMLKLVEYVMSDSKTTKTLLTNMNNALTRLENELAGMQYETEPTTDSMAREIPLSGTDVKILQFIQLKNGMACAEDLRTSMGYKGKNAASARLNRLYRLGVLERFQLGHKVFYRYGAEGKTTKTLIVSPP